MWEQIIISNRLQACSDELKGCGILDINILKILFNDPKAVPKEIIKILNIPNSTLTNAINRLVSKELLVRQLNPSDLRSLQLILTEKGKRSIISHRNSEKKIIGNIFNILSEDESMALINIFEKIAAEL